MAQEAEAPEGQEPEAPSNEEPATDAEPKTFDADYVKQLRSESAQWRVKAQQAQERAEEFEDAQKSELEKAQNKATRAEQGKAEAEAKLLRFEVAAEKQIPGDALDLLTGNTREDLEARADKILELVKSRNENTPAPDFDGGAREPAPDTDPDRAHNDVALALLGLKQ